MKSLKLVPTQEIESVISECKYKMWSHIEMKPEHQVNQKFISYMEETIEELQEVLNERKAS